MWCFCRRVKFLGAGDNGNHNNGGKNFKIDACSKIRKHDISSIRSRTSNNINSI